MDPFQKARYLAEDLESLIFESEYAWEIYKIQQQERLNQEHIDVIEGRIPD